MEEMRSKTSVFSATLRHIANVLTVFNSNNVTNSHLELTCEFVTLFSGLFQVLQHKRGMLFVMGLISAMILSR